MQSSYSTVELDYAAVLKSVCFSVNPLSIVEIGIGNGFSLDCFLDACPSEAVIKAYDIFDKFNGNHASFEKISNKFPTISLAEGDFFNLHLSLPDNSVDLLHIDIANNGNVYEFAFDNYIGKLTPKGIMILEGGSPERDGHDWMKRYEKPPINPLLKQNENNFKILTFGTIPSITLIKR